MRWYQAVPAPSIDQTQTIAKTFDGDGRDVKRVDGNVWFHTFPDTNSGSNSTTEYYVRSTVLGGQIVTKLDGGGAKKVTLVYTGSSVLAEQRIINGTSGVYWRHEDVVTGSYGKTGVNGQYGGNADDSPTGVEYDPLGGGIPVADPDYDLIPAQLTQFKFAGDNSQAENRCMLNGAPIPCTMLSMATQDSSHVTYDINIRAEGGYGLYSTLRGLVSTWRYNVRQIVDPEDQSIPASTYNQPQRWGKLADGRHTLLVGSFYASYLSSFAETLISRQTQKQDKVTAGPGTISDRITLRPLRNNKVYVNEQQQPGDTLAYTRFSGPGTYGSITLYNSFFGGDISISIGGLSSRSLFGTDERGLDAARLLVVLHEIGHLSRQFSHPADGINGIVNGSLTREVLDQAATNKKVYDACFKSGPQPAGSQLNSYEIL